MINNFESSPIPFDTENRRPIPVAIIDDTEENLYALSRYLKRAGFEVWEGHNGADALRLAARLPRVIILDVKLPDMIGYEVCRRIKSDPATAHIPVVHTSATYIELQDRSEGIEGGADAYFTAPLKPVELIATIMALSRVRDAEIKAGAAADQWRAGFDAISSGACLINGEGRIERCNAVLAKLAGKSREEIEGVSFIDFASNDVVSSLPYLRMLETHQRETLETHSRDHWWQITVDPLFDESGGWNGAICILSNISEKKSTEAQMRRSQRTLSELFENAPIGVHLMNEKGVILRANRAELELLGYDREELVGRNLADFHSDPNEIKEILAQLQRGGSVIDRETRFLRKDGTIKDVMLSCTGFWENGVLVDTHCFLRDITSENRKGRELARAQNKIEKHAEQLEREVEQRTAHLQESIQALEGVCYTIAHDLRAPLRSVHGFTKILQDQYASAFDDEGRKLADRIVNSASQMDNLIHDLLEYARLNHADLPRENIDLNEFVESVLKHMAPELQRRNANVDVDPLPEIHANPVVLEQILTNLLDNALKFVPSGTDPKIRIGGEKGDKVITLWIQDNGIGIKPEYHGSVFGMFQRLHHNENQYSGTGVGLAIVKKGMERMGGRVTIIPDTSSGTRFQLEFPLSTS